MSIKENAWKGKFYLSLKKKTNKPIALLMTPVSLDLMKPP